MRPLQAPIVMETKSTAEDVRYFRFPQWKRATIMKFLIVVGLAGTGVAMIAAGLLAWVVGEKALLVAGMTSGSILIAAGGLGLLRWLDGSLSKS